jgi:hypothetical protein
MVTKNFLPLKQNDVENPLMNSHEAAVAAMGLEVLARNGPKVVRTRSWVMRLFSAFTCMGLIFGSTVMGFSFKMVNDSQVGFFSSETGYFGPGIYLQFPWTLEEMHIVDVGVNVLKLNHLTSVFNGDQEYTIQDTTISYNVTDVKTYVETIRANKSPVFCQSLIETKVLEMISSEIDNSVDFNLLGENINVPRCGVTINSIILPSPPKPKTSRNQQQQQKQNTLDSAIDFQQALQATTSKQLEEVQKIQRQLRDDEEELKVKTEETNKKLEEANEKLEEANKQLEEANKQLEEANKQLEEVKAERQVERERRVERERERRVERERQAQEERERERRVERERQDQEEREQQSGSDGSTI